MVWLINTNKGQNNETEDEFKIIKQVASYAISCAEQMFELHYDDVSGKPFYRAKIPLLQPQSADNENSDQLLKVVKILKESMAKLTINTLTRETSLQNVLTISAEGVAVILEVKSEYRNCLQPMYSNLLRFIKLYHPNNNVNHLATTIANINSFDVSKFVFDKTSLKVLNNLPEAEVKENTVPAKAA